MVERQPMSDLVVIVPGITGSVLQVDNEDVWALSGRAVMNGVVSLGRSVARLKLPDGFGDTLPEKEGEGEPADGVEATKLMPDLHVIPGLWSPIKGYSALSTFFTSRFSMTPATLQRPGNLMEFAYDWRLSNAVNGRRLAAEALPLLEHWRKQAANPDAKLVLVCHSMGGLVARWFLEVVDGWKNTRTLITIGTPFQGAIGALEALANGVSFELGPFRRDLSQLVRSFPSAYELLPTYPCLDVGGSNVRRLSEVSGLGLNAKMLASATLLHTRIAEKVQSRADRGYDIVAVKGVMQPTAQSARTSLRGIEPIRSYKGVDQGGDGTVPRPSAHPPEWDSESTGYTVGASQRHGALQDSEGVHAQLFMKLTTGNLGRFMGGEGVGLDLPHLLVAGEPLWVEVTAAESTLALNATVTPHDDPRPVMSPQLLTNIGAGRYRTEFADVPPGTYEVKVRPAAPTGQISPVSDITIVWDPIVA